MGLWALSAPAGFLYHGLVKRNDDAPASKADLASGLGELKTELKGDIARLDQKTDRIAGELVKTNARMTGMEERLVALIREESARTVGRIDAFLSKLETYGRETTLIPHALDEHGKTLKDHERRLVKLERP